jgi:predicted DNA-binding transcriptional regulator AlpA
MQQWRVRVVARYDDEDAARAAAAFEAIRSLAPNGGWLLDPNRQTWTVARTEEANSALLAIEFAMAHIEDVLARSALPRRAVLELAATRVDAIEASHPASRAIVDALAGEMPTPDIQPLVDLVGAGEVLALLGISKQRLYQLRAANRFPDPLIELVSGPIWHRSVIESYGATRRPPGRPRKAAPPTG